MKKIPKILFDFIFIFTLTGATFGTGITAIKLTALGRPQLLVSIST